jgi:4-hydroxy-4-methyl-2-oxoglutarate aldolase
MTPTAGTAPPGDGHAGEIVPAAIVSGAIDDALIARFSVLDTCAVSDALDALNLSGAVEGLAPVWEGARVVGRAVTTRLAPGPPDSGAPGVHLGVRAIESAAPGDVIVIDNAGRAGMGSWGGLLTLSASLRHVAGVITDGACRDVDEARGLAFPVFARGGAVRTARGRAHEQSCGEPVSLGGVTVHPGDVVMADGTGVVVVAAGDVERVLPVAERIAAREHLMQADLRGGRRVSQVLGTDYESMLAAADAGGEVGP